MTTKLNPNGINTISGAIFRLQIKRKKKNINAKKY